GDHPRPALRHEAHPAFTGWALAKTAGTHAKVRYRCFLPDLAGFTAPRRPDHKLFHGESGIRTHDTLSSIHAFQACAFRRSAISPNHIYSGERRIRTYGTVTGTPDFESGAFDHSASSPLHGLSSFLYAQGAKEILQQRAAFVGEHPARHFDAVVVPLVLEQV